MTRDLVKSDSFDGTNYSRWAEKLMFFFRFLNLYHVMDENLTPIPSDPIPEAGKPVGENAINELNKQSCFERSKNPLFVATLRMLYLTDFMIFTHQLRAHVNFGKP